MQIDAAFLRVLVLSLPVGRIGRRQSVLSQAVPSWTDARCFCPCAARPRRDRDRICSARCIMSCAFSMKRPVRPPAPCSDSGFITFLGGIAIMVIVGAATMGIGAFVIGVAWAFFYNKYYTRKLLERGYRLASTDAENARAASALGIVAPVLVQPQPAGKAGLVEPVPCWAKPSQKLQDRPKNAMTFRSMSSIFSAFDRCTR